MYEWGGTVSCIMSRTETTVVQGQGKTTHNTTRLNTRTKTETTVAQGRGKATQNTTQLNKTQLNKTHLDNSEALCVSGEG